MTKKTRLITNRIKPSQSATPSRYEAPDFHSSRWSAFITALPVGGNCPQKSSRANQSHFNSFARAPSLWREVVMSVCALGACRGGRHEMRLGCPPPTPTPFIVSAPASMLVYERWDLTRGCDSAVPRCLIIPTRTPSEKRTLAWHTWKHTHTHTHNECHLQRLPEAAWPA